MVDDARILVELQKLSDGQTHVTDKVDSIAKDVDSLSKTVRGSNGTPGLVTNVATIQTNMAVMGRDIADLRLCVEDFKDKYRGGNLPSKETDASGKNKNDEAVIKTMLSKDWLLDKLTYLALAFAVWFLLDILPQLLSHFTTP